jgi:hypothetical protein
MPSVRTNRPYDGFPTPVDAVRERKPLIDTIDRVVEVIPFILSLVKRIGFGQSHPPGI